MATVKIRGSNPCSGGDHFTIQLSGAADDTFVSQTVDDLEGIARVIADRLITAYKNSKTKQQHKAQLNSVNGVDISVGPGAAP